MFPQELNEGAMEKDHSTKIKEGLAAAALEGRRPGRSHRVSTAAIERVLATGVGTKEGAMLTGLSKSQFIRRRREIKEGKQ
jgi:DNA invertase Pin-like site-specific DNA recombinase